MFSAWRIICVVVEDCSVSTNMTNGTGWGRIMEDINVICVSSGSDGDSDLEVISSYNEEKEDAVAFIRGQWLAVTPVSLAY